MNSRKPTKLEASWLRSIRQVGCICCIEDGLIVPGEVPEEHTAIHHIDGSTKKRAHFKTLPLCPNHHQYGDISVHGNKREFVDKYGTELLLLVKVEQLVNTHIYGGD